MTTQTIESKTSLPFFRNPTNNKLWYLQRRPDQPSSEANFILGPNHTVQALDEAEAMLLASVGLVDVAKDSPVITQSMDALKKELEAERAKNAELIAQNTVLKSAGADKSNVAVSQKKK